MVLRYLHDWREHPYRSEGPPSNSGVYSLPNTIRLLLNHSPCPPHSSSTTLMNIVFISLWSMSLAADSRSRRQVSMSLSGRELVLARGNACACTRSPCHPAQTLPHIYTRTLPRCTGLKLRSEGLYIAECKYRSSSSGRPRSEALIDSFMHSRNSSSEQ